MHKIFLYLIVMHMNCIPLPLVKLHFSLLPVINSIHALIFILNISIILSLIETSELVRLILTFVVLFSIKILKHLISCICKSEFIQRNLIA